MNSLLAKIQQIEEEVAGRLTQVTRESNEELEDLKAAESRVIEDFRKRAQGRASAIIAEHEASARQEAGALKQDRDIAVSTVGEQATKNRGRAVQRALELFSERYGL